MIKKEVGVREAIIKALNDKIINEILEDLKELKLFSDKDRNGNVRIEPSSKDSEVVKYLINKLAEKRLAYGLAKGEEPEKW
jgi:hypothetical protein